VGNRKVGRFNGRLKPGKRSKPFAILKKLLKQKMHKDAGNTKGEIETNGKWYLHMLARQFLGEWS